MTDTTWRIIRSILQLIAGGGLTALFLQIAKDVPESYAPYIVMASTALVAIAQNVYESLSGSRLIGPTVVSKKAAEHAVEDAYTSVPGIDPKPQVKV